MIQNLGVDVDSSRCSMKILLILQQCVARLNAIDYGCFNVM